jgi:hypothetical protein
MTNDPKSMDWAFWFYWIMATTIGWMVGQMFFSGIPIIVSGVAISVLQGVVLYQRIHKSWRWSVISGLSWIIGYILHLILFSSNAGNLVGPMIGATVGISQWLLLRKEFDWAGWWIIICILAWTSGLTTMPGLISSGTLPGALTGITLVILFRFSSPPKQQMKNN